MSGGRAPQLHAWQQAVKAKEKKAKAKEKADKAAEKKAAEKEKKDKKAAADKEKKAAAKDKASGKTQAKKTPAQAKEAEKEAEPSSKKEKRKAPAKDTPRKVGCHCTCTEKALSPGRRGPESSCRSDNATHSAGTGVEDGGHFSEDTVMYSTL